MGKKDVVSGEGSTEQQGRTPEAVSSLQREVPSLVCLLFLLSLSRKQFVSLGWAADCLGLPQ